MRRSKTEVQQPTVIGQNSNRRNNTQEFTPPDEKHQAQTEEIFKTQVGKVRGNGHLNQYCFSRYFAEQIL